MLGVEIVIDVHFTDVMDEVEVEVLHPRLFELLLKDLLDLVHVGKVVAGELRSKVERVAGILAERLAHGNLGLPTVVAPRGVEVVDAVLDSVIDHLLRSGLVDLGIVAVDHRQAHGTHTERRKLEPLKILVQHAHPLCYVSLPSHGTHGHVATYGRWWSELQVKGQHEERRSFRGFRGRSAKQRACSHKATGPPR